MKTTPTGLAMSFIGGAVALYMVAIGPLRSSLSEKTRELNDQTSLLRSMQNDIDQQKYLESCIREQKEHSKRRQKTLLVPMLNSYAMRAKSLLETIAAESGIDNVTYDEGIQWVLPVPPEMLPKSRTARRSVQVRATGDYAAIASFILRAERKLPLMTVQSLTIRKSDAGDPENQTLELTVEWPCEGEVVK